MTLCVSAYIVMVLNSQVTDLCGRNILLCNKKKTFFGLFANREKCQPFQSKQLDKNKNDN